MKKEYIITNEELCDKGLDLNDYAIDGNLINAIINRGLDICVSRCCYLNDNIKGEKGIETELDNNQDLVATFKKLQFSVLWNLIFMGEEAPIDIYTDTIITHELGFGKINGIQKGLYYKNN